MDCEKSVVYDVNYCLVFRPKHEKPVLEEAGVMESLEE